MTTDTDKLVGSATPKQAAFIAVLLEQRTGYSDGFRERVTTSILEGRLAKSDASNIITWLLNRPKRVGVPHLSDAATKIVTDAVEIPNGHYAIKNETGTNDLDFYKVETPTEGRYRGMTFVKRVIGGHPEFPVRNSVERRAILQRIKDAGVEAAAVLYGREIGRCYRCNRTLTDELSRELGIGPVCRGGTGGHDPD
jgi:Family of unknown function (DUF6011)